jgi:predicted P-loop ATPase/GTPase
LDLSFPTTHSVNDGIDKDEFSLQYCTVKHAINLILKTGNDALMGKVDIKSAYRIISVNPSDRYLLGMYWKG